MKQTAVEWLVEQLTENGKYPFILTEDVVAIELAKAMEKEQIMDAYWEIPLPEEKYFEKTFKSE